MFIEYSNLLIIIMYMKNLLNFDWLRTVQFKCNTSGNSVTPVQITKKVKIFKQIENQTTNHYE